MSKHCALQLTSNCVLKPTAEDTVRQAGRISLGCGLARRLLFALNVIPRLAFLFTVAVNSASGAEPPYFVASWGPFRVSSALTCMMGSCDPAAYLEVRDLSLASGLVRCSSRIESFPGGVILTSKWVEVHGDPVLFVYVAPAEQGTAVEHSLRPELNCTFTASWLPPRVAILGADAAQGLDQCSRPSPTGISGGWTVTAELAQQLEADLPKLSPLLEGRDPSIFFRQYVGIVQNGKRVVYINAADPDVLESDDSSWVSSPLYVCDGGEQFWGAVYNPESRAFSQLEFNNSPPHR